MKNKIIKMLLTLLILIIFDVTSVYAEEPILISVGDYDIVSDGVYQLEMGYSGTITIKNTASEVTIIGSNSKENPHINTQITFEDSRTEPVIFTIQDLNIIAEEGYHGIDFQNTGDRDNKLYISGSCKIVADANNQNEDVTYGTGIYVREGTKLTIDKKSGLADSDASLEAIGGNYGAGIGGGKSIYYYSGGHGFSYYKGGIIKIAGGKITAIAGYRGAGIGGGGYRDAGEIEISGGEVTAIGGYMGAGIGGGSSGAGGKIDITGGKVIAKGGEQAAGIGGGCQGTGGGIIEITGGEVTAEGGDVGAGIGGGYKGTGGTIKISGGNVTVRGGGQAAGIGGGKLGTGGAITIIDGKVTAYGGYTGAGIGGGGSARPGGTIEILGGEVTATGGMFAAGIGGGASGSGGEIEISGGEVTATSIYRGAGIGGGCWGAGGTIIIKNNPSIFATKDDDENATDIGNGDDTTPDQLTILQNESGTNLKYIQIEIKNSENQKISSNATITINDTITYTDSDGMTGVFIDAGSSSYTYKVETEEYVGSGIVTNVNDQNNQREYVLASRVTFDWIQPKNVTTYDGNDGTITVSASGGYGTYEYSKDNGASWQDNNVFSGLSAGTYQIKARDAGYTSNVSQMNSVEITKPDRVVIIDLECQNKSYESNDGVITIANVQGGYGTYQYSKDDGASWQYSNVFNGLSSGMYEMKARDRQYIVNISEIKSVEITEPDKITIIDVKLQNVTTYGGNEGVITVSAIGGYGTYEYSKDNGTSWQDSNVFNLLIAGTYDIEVRDKKDTGNIDKKNSQEITEPERVVIIDVELQNETTYGGNNGVITVSAIEGGYGTYQYSKDNGASWQDSNVFNGLSAGTYEIKARDKEDVGNISEIKSVDITEPDRVTVTDAVYQNITSYGGNDGIITVSAIGGKGTYEYNKNNEEIWQDSNIFSGLRAGRYEMKVRDKEDTGNVSEKQFVEITQPSKPSVFENEYTPSYEERKIENVVKTKDNHKIGIKQITKENGQKKATIKIDEQSIEIIIQNLKKGEIIDIEVNDKTDIIELEFSVRTLKSMQSREEIISIQTHQGTYTLPSTAIDIEELSKKMGKSINSEDIKIKVKISKPQVATIKIVQEATKEKGLSVVVPSVNFEIWGIYKGKQINIDKLNQMVTRLIPIPKGTDIQRITTCVIIEKDKTIRSVPTKLIEINGQYYACIKSMTNSTYTLIENKVIYTDIQGHWAKNKIQKMAEKLVVEGMQNDKTTYNPDEEITRAELAKILVKAMALKPKATNQFVDVQKGSEEEKYIDTTYTYGIIKGTSKNTFAPNNKITRQDTMTMIYRVAKLIGYKESEEKIDMNRYKDYTKVADYAKEAVSWNVSNKIINGKTKTILAPEQNITRAEIAVIIDRLLNQADLIE